MTTATPVPGQFPDVPGNAGNDHGPWTSTHRAAATGAVPALVPVPVPAATGNQPGNAPTSPAGNAGNKPPRSRHAAGNGNRTRGNGNAGRKIGGSRLIPGTEVPIPRGKIAWALGVVAFALTLVIAAPTLISSQDLYKWAGDPHGLGLHDAWRLLVPVSLDVAAVACIGMTLVATWRRDRAVVFELLVWVFAGTSAYAQYTYGLAARDAGGPRDSWWFMPALALLGPLLLEVTLHTLRKWARSDAGESVPMLRWLVSPWRSLAAWAYALREGLTPAEAWVFKRDKKLLKTMAARPVDAVIHAANALQSLDQYALRQWLAARGTFVTQEHLDAAVDLVPTDLWDAGEPEPAGNEGTGTTPSVPATVPPAVPVPVPASSQRGPSTAGGNRRSTAGNGTGNDRTFPDGNTFPGNDGNGNTPGTDLDRWREQHRERLITVKANLPGWASIPESDLTIAAVKTAGGFAKQGYASEIRKILLADRARLAATK